jgi:uncharacterized integral membrane protein
MSRRLITALVLIALCVVLYIFNTHRISVEFGFSDLKGTAAFVFMGFTAVGVVIGALLK